MRRKALMSSKGISYHGLTKTAEAAFKDFHNLSGDRLLTIQTVQGLNWTDYAEDVPFVLTESTAFEGRTGFLYIEEEHFLGSIPQRFYLPDTREYLVIQEQSEDKLVPDAYRNIYGIVRIKVEVSYIASLPTIPSTNRVVWCDSSAYYNTTTTPADMVFFGWTQPHYVDGELISPVSENKGNCGAGQHAGIGVFVMDDTVEAYYIQIGIPSDAATFGTMLYAGNYGSGGGSNNELAVLRLGVGSLLLYNRLALTTPNDAVAHGDIYDHPSQYDNDRRWQCSASNSYNDRLVVMGGWLPATDPWSPSTTVSLIEYITISTPGDGLFFGDLAVAQNQSAATSNGTGNKAVIASAYNLQVLDMTTLSNAVNIGTIPVAGGNGIYTRAGSDGNQNRGLFSTYNDIVYIDLLTTVEATAFGSTNVLCKYGGYGESPALGDTFE